MTTAKAIEIELETLRALFDLVVSSMNYGSGFYDEDDVKIILKVAEQIDAIDDLPSPSWAGRETGEFLLTEPHLWHQECKLPWRCGKAANDPIHRPELPK